MLLGPSRHVRYQGAPGRLSVVRQDGHAWGRVEMDDGRDLDVEPECDVYEMDDRTALDLIEDAMLVEANISWAQARTRG